MTHLTDVKIALNDLLRKTYGYKIHGMEITEGYERPSFFVDVRQTNASDINANYLKKAFYITITYFQEIRSEADNLKKVQEIEELLRPNDLKNKKRLLRLKVGNRYLPVSGYGSNYIGTNSDILQIEFNVEFQERKEESEDAPYMEDVTIKQKLER
ncbi:hypothetical protein NE619_13145 [Anaerovorax odorimutans]|uniref:Uncharacterized protein n=1 Tax=Anaerovorax odorimutans TaxID=109327 RepID=A0ABT1RR74_9FIRM|nr:hypothetical protein [Anaerovorax odorimutans]MCQ4637673.1 hypothetical protein [Anaerovorax odorimutans]